MSYYRVTLAADQQPALYRGTRETVRLHVIHHVLDRENASRLYDGLAPLSPDDITIRRARFADVDDETYSELRFA